MKYTKTAVSFLIAALVIVTVPQATFAFTIQDNTNTATVVAASVQDNTNSDTVIPPVVQNNNPAPAVINPPVVQNNTNSNTITHPVVQDNTNTNTVNPPVVHNNDNTNTVTPPQIQDNTNGGTVSNPTTPATPAVVVSGGGGFVSGGSSVFGGGASSSVLPVLVNTSDCNYITSYMNIGKTNSSTEVVKLQNFLNTYEGAKIAVTGVFDSATLAAVNAFQTKYIADIMYPWGATTPSGQVYITTTKKINEIFCKKNFTLTAAQVAEIEAYRTSKHTSTPSLTGTVVGGAASSTTVGTANSTSTTTVGQTQVGAAAKTNVLGKIWNFVKRIFGR
jgi:hypothetical protein